MSSFAINYQKHKMMMVPMGHNKNMQECFHLYLLYKGAPLRTAERDYRKRNKILFNSDSLLGLLWPAIVLKLCHSLRLAQRSRSTALQFIQSNVYFSKKPTKDTDSFLQWRKKHSGQWVLEIQNYVNERSCAYRKSLAYRFSHIFRR